MNIECGHCTAKKWKGEPHLMCCDCKQWQRFPVLQEPLQPLKSLFEGTTLESKHFLQNIRKYNNCFQMTSFGADVLESDVHGYSWASLKVKGKVYHRVGSLLPANNEAEKFLQIYFINDRSEQLQRRCRIAAGAYESIIMQIQNLLLDTNHLVQQSIVAKDNLLALILILLFVLTKYQQANMLVATIFLLLLKLLQSSQVRNTGNGTSSFIRNMTVFKGFLKPIQCMTQCSTHFFTLLDKTAIVLGLIFLIPLKIL